MDNLFKDTHFNFDYISEIEGLISEDVGNKLTPFKNLIQIVVQHLDGRDVNSLSVMEKFMLEQIYSCKVSLEYLVNTKLIEKAMDEKIQKQIENTVDYNTYIRNQLDECIPYEQYKKECENGERDWALGNPKNSEGVEVVEVDSFEKRLRKATTNFIITNPFF